MPYIDKNGKPVLWEETDYFNQYRKALIYYPVKAKRISGIPDCDFTYEILVSPTPTPTQTGTPTPTPTPSAPSVDPDAAAYLADVVISGGTTNPTIEAAVNTLFTDLKSNGLYSKMLAMYPYVGATAASHSINALLNKTYDITWYGGMSHSISGATGDGINGYGDTNFLSVNFTASDDYSFGLYQNTENTPARGEEISMGTFFGSTYFQLATNVNSVNWFMRSNSNTATQGANSGNIDGNYIVNRTGTTYTSLSRNATTILSNTTAPVSLQGTNKIFVFNMGYNNPSIPYGNGYANQTFGFTFMGEGLSNSEITTLDGIINTFQTSLGRNTY